MNLLAARYIDRWAGVAVHLGLHAVGRATGRRLLPPGATTPPSAGRTWARPRRVLAIKFYGLGNLVMILPTLAALRAAIPEVEIDFLTLPGNEALLEQSGLVARVLTVGVATFPRFARAVARLVQTLRARGYDTVLDFEQFLKVSGIFGFLSGAPELIGFDTEGQHRGWLYTTRVVSTDSVHTRDLFLRLAAPLGVPSGAAPPALPRGPRRPARRHLGHASRRRRGHPGRGAPRADAARALRPARVARRRLLQRPLLQPLPQQLQLQDEHLHRPGVHAFDRRGRGAGRHRGALLRERRAGAPRRRVAGDGPRHRLLRAPRARAGGAPPPPRP